MGVIQKMVAALGMTAELSGRNDILIEGKKFSGNAFAASRGMKAHHGTIMVNTDLSRLAGYLNVSEKKMRAKGVTSVKSRVCNLSDFNDSVTVQTVLEILKKEYAAEYGAYTEYQFHEQELARIEELYAIQSSWEWRFGQTPAFDYQLEERFSFGEMQFLFRIEGGLISDAAVFSDALDTELVQLVKNCMVGVKFCPKDISEAFEKNSDRPEFKEIGLYIASIEL
jgi:lipoate-protein ligase A